MHKLCISVCLSLSLSAYVDKLKPLHWIWVIYLNRVEPQHGSVLLNNNLDLQNTAGQPIISARPIYFCRFHPFQSVHTGWSLSCNSL